MWIDAHNITQHLHHVLRAVANAQITPMHPSGSSHEIVGDCVEK